MIPSHLSTLEINSIFDFDQKQISNSHYDKEINQSPFNNLILH
jgi:hypothetical protein